jgi:hypothetical protein
LAHGQAAIFCEFEIETAFRFLHSFSGSVISVIGRRHPTGNDPFVPSRGGIVLGGVADQAK